MNEIKQWAVNVCVTLAATGIFSMLIPHGNMEKVMKFAVSVFFLSCLLFPFFTGLPELQWNAQESTGVPYENIQETMNRQFLELSRKRIEQIVGQILAAEGIQPEKITADIHISEDNSVSINKVTVTLNGTSRLTADRMRSIIKEQTGIETETMLISGEG